MKLLLFLALIASLSVIEMSESFAEFISSPRQQLTEGINSEDIQCRENRVLVIRDNGNPACVTEKTAEKRDWKIIQTEFKINSTNENNILYDEDMDSETSKEIIIKNVAEEPKPLESALSEINILNVTSSIDFIDDEDIEKENQQIELASFEEYGKIFDRNFRLFSGIGWIDMSGHAPQSITHYYEDPENPGEFILDIDKTFDVRPVIFPENSLIFIQTDKIQYHHKDIIQIEGQVADVVSRAYPETLVSIDVTMDNTKFHTYTTAEVNPDGSYQATIDTSGSKWFNEGIYTLTADPGFTAISDSTEIELVSAFITYHQTSLYDDAVTVSPEITVLLDREEVLYGDDGINFVAAFPIGTVLRYDAIDSNNESIWPYHTFGVPHYSHVPIGFDKGIASVGTYLLEPGKYTIVVSTPNSTNTNEIKKSFTVLDSKCCNPINIYVSADVFIPGDEFVISVKAPSKIPLTLNLIDPNEKITQTKQITTNKDGRTNSLSFILSRIAIPGIWTLEAKSKINSDSISLLVLPTPDELIKKSPSSEKILASYANELANKKSGYEVLLTSSLKPFEDDGREFKRALVHSPAPNTVYDKIMESMNDGVRVNSLGITTITSTPHEKYSINEGVGYYAEDWIPTYIPDGLKLLYTSTFCHHSENCGLGMWFVPTNFTLDPSTYDNEWKHDGGFHIRVSFDVDQVDEMEDIIEHWKEVRESASGKYGGFRDMTREGKLVYAYEGGDKSHYYNSKLSFHPDDFTSVTVSSNYHTIDELIPVFDSIMK